MKTHKLYLLLILLCSTMGANAQGPISAGGYAAGDEVIMVYSMDWISLCAIGDDASIIGGPHPFSISIPSGVVEIEGIECLIYPNPVQDMVNVKISDNYLENFECTLFNIQGQALYKQTITSGVTNIPMASRAKGTYILVIKNNERITSFKISKK